MFWSKYVIVFRCNLPKKNCDYAFVLCSTCFDMFRLVVELRISFPYLIIEIVTWQLSIFVFRNLVFFLEIRDLLAIYIRKSTYFFYFFII